MNAPTFARVGCASHPLHPMTQEEIEKARAVASKVLERAESLRFVSIQLDEPPKADVLAWRAEKPIARKAFLVLLRRDTAAPGEKWGASPRR